ncbi:MAG: formate dehydrogenase accessory sulfurtransferase FdhD [Lachnospiraceae bacterium]|nr:formate dehydrogenase accessory sulfurtransferase FdhD [Lachnospiraceae bacterium]
MDRRQVFYEENTRTLEVSVYHHDGRTQNESRMLLKEYVLDLTVNDKPWKKIVCTKQYLEELITGRLYTEGLISGVDDLIGKEIDADKGEGRVRLKNGAGSDREGMADNDPCRDLPGSKTIPATGFRPEWIFSLAALFSEDAELHRMTGGTHICFLAREGEMLFSCEDISRHNALDKAVGHGLIAGESLSDCMLYTSGRVQADTMKKVILAGIPILISKSVPTAEAAAMAGEYGITLISKAYRDSFEVW